MFAGFLPGLQVHFSRPRVPLTAQRTEPWWIEDALAVCAAFNTLDRLAGAFGFELLSPEGFEAGAKYLLKRGYR
jgi:hypothetical protein